MLRNRRGRAGGEEPGSFGAHGRGADVRCGRRRHRRWQARARRPIFETERSRIGLVDAGVAIQLIRTELAGGLPLLLGHLPHRQSAPSNGVGHRHADPGSAQLGHGREHGCRDGRLLLPLHRLLQAAHRAEGVRRAEHRPGHARAGGAGAHRRFGPEAGRGTPHVLRECPAVAPLVAPLVAGGWGRAPPLPGLGVQRRVDRDCPG
mmetsp:Transcript_55923/g.162005  ORF Transcript_55923/g.162005 Transcript_55923/m.162005 type:complete len:205 (+) Transcript_55923:1365-1979(+)